MSDHPVDINRERLNRLSTAVADLTEASNQQGRDILWSIAAMTERFDKNNDRLVTLEHAVRGLATDQLLLGNRVEEGFSRPLRLNVRMDEAEDKASS